MLDFNLTIRYKVGKCNIVPNTLLRLLAYILLEPLVDYNNRVLNILYRYVLVEVLNKVLLLLELLLITYYITLVKLLNNFKSYLRKVYEKDE